MKIILDLKFFIFFFSIVEKSQRRFGSMKKKREKDFFNFLTKITQKEKLIREKIWLQINAIMTNEMTHSQNFSRSRPLYGQ